MNRYGQLITWSTITAPKPASGSVVSYSLRDAVTRQLIDGEDGDFLAAVLHSKKAELNFEAKVTSASTDFLDLSVGAAVTVSTIPAGVVLATRASERWQLGQEKRISLTATHYPDMVLAGGAAAGTDLDAFTPDQAALGIVTPGDEIIYSTFGLTHASGVVHGLTLEQQLTITEDEPSPDGKILGAADHAYMRTLQLDLLATGAKPAVGSVLVIPGAPNHAGGYKIESSEERLAEKRGKMYAISAFWIPVF